MNGFSLNISVNTNKKTGKPEILLMKKIVDENEIKIFANLLLENKKLLLPIQIEDELQFYSRLKNKKII